MSMPSPSRFSRIHVVLILGPLFLPCVLAKSADVPLFWGGWQDSTETELWGTRSGAFAGDTSTVGVRSGDPVATPANGYFNSEAQRKGFVGADFTYSALVSVDPNAAPVREAHLQFRISDEGRYGVRVLAGTLTLYRFLREDEPCSQTNPGAINHCPSFGPSDLPIYRELMTCNYGQQPCMCPAPDTTVSMHKVEIIAQGSSFTVSLDDVTCFQFLDQTAGNELRVGRFGIYAYGTNVTATQFQNISATSDPTAESNFALLYSTAGYEANETKRALVRTLNDLPSSWLDTTHSTFTVYQGDNPVLTGPLVPLLAPLLQTAGIPIFAKTFGMQLLEADFSSITAPGSYVIQVNVATTSGIVTLGSSSFQIGPRLVTGSLLHQMTNLNALARRAADEDMRRNWCFENPSNGCSNDPEYGPNWSVTEDGAFYADRADSGAGSVVRRVFNGANGPFPQETDFHYVGEVTIISGCEAQMQFAVNDLGRWAVSLEAGIEGGCVVGGGPGAVRIIHEDVYGPHSVATALFPASSPFVLGHPYDVDITVQSGNITVALDGAVVFSNIPGPSFPELGFALKAWASTARFRRVQAWNVNVPLQKSSDGTRIPFYDARSSLFGPITFVVPCQDWVIPGLTAVDPTQKDNACNPFFSQLSGFHDCNNYIGEATSHGTYLNALMEVWTRRAPGMSQSDREVLRQSIITNALYIEGLYQEAGETGEFAHSEMGRGGVDTNLGPFLTQIALYGESAFADKGEAVDPRLAKLACMRSIASVNWLTQNNLFGDPTQSSIIYAHISRCAAREGLPGFAAYWTKAVHAAETVVSNFSMPGYLAHQYRDTGRVYPWFEGVYEVMKSNGVRYASPLQGIAQLLINHLTQEHVCDDGAPGGKRCPKNGFLVLPQASDTTQGNAIPAANWNDMQSVPQAIRSAGLPYYQDYLAGANAVAASDMVYLAQLVGPQMASQLEPLASGNLNWMLGLNPGVPISKLANPFPTQPWQAAAFTYNTDIPSTRTIDGWRTPESSSKGWLGLPREGGASSPHHEAWWIDPLNNGFVSLINGHVIWDNQWDFVSSGGWLDPKTNKWNNLGWISGETFLLTDGQFIKGSLLLEGWLNGDAAPQDNPYPVGNLAFFDTTHIDRLSTGWTFDNPDNALYGLASRASTYFCDQKGFLGGRFTGHYIGERIGLLCTPTTASFFNINPDELNKSGWGFTNIDTANWAQVSRAATNICNNRGFVGGFFTGLGLPVPHSPGMIHGLVCLNSDVGQWFDAPESEIDAAGYTIIDIDTVPWAYAARAATDVCLNRHFSGGFFTGHQLNGNHGVVCLSQ